MTTLSTMYDGVNLDGIPDESPPYVAAYWNGRYANHTAAVTKFPHARVFAIDVLGDAPLQCSIFDIETGDGTPAMATSWCAARLGHDPSWIARLYCNLSTWPSVKYYVSKLSAEFRARTCYWIANPTGQRHLVPGSEATQYLWAGSYDESVIDTTYFS